MTRPDHHDEPSDDTPPAAFWDNLYAERDQIWSGNPNKVLVDVVDGAAPGRALDLGCGEGGDSVWLAGAGWQVTAVDVSQVAIDRAAQHAAERGVADRTDFQLHDLDVTFPDGAFDLVSAHFLHSPVEFQRVEVLRRAAAAVAPGGLLLIVGHAAFPPWARNHDHDHHFPSPDEEWTSLGLAEDSWTAEIREVRDRDAIGPDGQHAPLSDSVLAARRLR